MATTTKRRATYQDLLEAPENLVAELIDGELHKLPRPAGRHAVASSALGGELSGPFYRGRGGPGGWWILDEPELHLGEDVLVPDLAGWKRERMPQIPEGPEFTVPPDWLCEVVSPSTEKLDRSKKMAIYAQAGVVHLWLVNPTARTVEVYRRSGEGWLLLATHADDVLMRAEPFDAVEIDLLGLWGEPRPPSPPGP